MRSCSRLLLAVFLFHTVGVPVVAAQSIGNTDQSTVGSGGTPYGAALKAGVSREQAETVNAPLINVSEDALVGLFNGDATQSINLFVPSGHNGHKPSLPLRYSSNLVNTNSEFGFGWGMELGRIYRVRDRRGGELYGDELEAISKLP